MTKKQNDSEQSKRFIDATKKAEADEMDETRIARLRGLWRRKH